MKKQHGGRRLGKPNDETKDLGWVSQQRAISASCRLLWTLQKRLGIRFTQEAIDSKGPTIMRDVLEYGGTSARLYALRLLKAMLPYLGKKWRQNNIHVVSSIFEHVRPEPIESWLVARQRDSLDDEDESWENILAQCEEESGMSSGYSSFSEEAPFHVASGASSAQSLPVGVSHFPDLEKLQA